MVLIRFFSKGIATAATAASSKCSKLIILSLKFAALAKAGVFYHFSEPSSLRTAARFFMFAAVAALLQLLQLGVY